jgi:hypothetical protein
MVAFGIIGLKDPLWGSSDGSQRCDGRGFRLVDLAEHPAYRREVLTDRNDSLLRPTLIGGGSLQLVRALLVRPNSDAAQQRAVEIGESFESFTSGMSLAVARLRELAEQTTATVEVYLYDMLPTWRVIALDEALFVQYQHLDTTSRGTHHPCIRSAALLTAEPCTEASAGSSLDCSVPRCGSCEAEQTGIEAEFKARVRDPDRVRELLRERAAEHNSVYSDVYFDTAERTLTRGGSDRGKPSSPELPPCL